MICSLMIIYKDIYIYIIVSYFFFKFFRLSEVKNIWLILSLALQVFGRDWKKVENFVETRTGA